MSLSSVETSIASAPLGNLCGISTSGDRFVIGTPEDCHGQLRPYWEELGVTTFVFRTHFIGMPIENALHSMKLISSELLPELRKASPIALEDFQAE